MKLIFLFVSVFLIVQRTQCLFEDQTGSYDWRQQYVGKPLFWNVDSSQNRLYVATEKHVLAALNLKTGSILWRKIFETSTNGEIDYVIWSSNEIVVVTANGQRVQSFEYKNGFAKWEYTLFRPSEQVKIVGIESKQEPNSFYLTNGHQACYANNKELACVDFPAQTGFVHEIFETPNQGVYFVGYKDNVVHKVQYNLMLSSQLSKSTTTENEAIKLQNCVKSSNSNDLACYHENEVLIGQIKPGDSFQFRHLSIKSNDLIEKSRLVWSKENLFLFESPEQSSNEFQRSTRILFLFQLTNQQNSHISLVEKFSSVAAYDLVNTKSNEVFLVYAKHANKLEFQTYSLKEAKPVAELSVSVNMNENEKASLIQLHVHFVEKKNSIVLVGFFDDYSLSAYNNGVKYFTREEALAYIVNVEMVEFPLLHLQEEFEDEFGSSQSINPIQMFFKRLRSQFSQLREFLVVDLAAKLKNYMNNMNNLKRPSSNSANSASVTPNADEISRDEFNLNKLIIAVSSIGKVFGLYTASNGRILWSFYLKNAQPFEINAFKNQQSIPLFLQRTTAHYPHEAQCALLSKMKVDNGFKTLVFFFNPITGKPSKNYPKEGLVLDYLVKQAFVSTKINGDFLKPLILLDSANKLHILPQKSEELLVKYSKPAILYTAQTENDKTNSITGFAMKYTNQPLPELWRVSLEDETIVAIGAKLPNDRIHSHGKVLGDRSVLYKYLNPNLIGVVTTGQDAQKVPFINLYLIDTVTGSIINSFNHKRCRGPVHIVHSENWFVYSYYSIKYKRFELTSLELFEGSTQFNSTHFSSLDDIKPVFYTKSFIIPKSFDSMQVTLTEKGISTKDIIVASQFGIVYEIPWILLDPRRPLKMTDLEREENLLPYVPEIPLNYEFSLNYYNYVYNIRGIYTAPSGLESTSLVFSYGLDIFFTRVFPSKTFDMLREDFDYFFIITLMVGLLLGTIISKKLASSSNLKKAWK